jgi:hypothetical protein
MKTIEEEVKQWMERFEERNGYPATHIILNLNNREESLPIDDAMKILKEKERDVQSN